MKPVSVLRMEQCLYLHLFVVLSLLNGAIAATVNCSIGSLNTAATRCYTLLGSTTRTWASGRTHCQSLGGDMAVIDSTAEASFVNTHAVFGPAFFWVGLSDTDTEGVWKWVDGSTSLGMPWTSGSPATDPSAHCALRSKDGTLENYPCYYSKWVLCQLPPVVTPDPESQGKKANRYKREPDNILEDQTTASCTKSRDRFSCAALCSRDVTCLGFTYVTDDVTNCCLTESQAGSSVVVDGQTKRNYRKV